MLCRVSELRYKEVINVRDGSVLGFVSDVEIDTVTAKTVALIIYGKTKLFGLLGRYDDIIIEWADIEVIGEDTILINIKPDLREFKPQKKNNFMNWLMG